MLRAEQKIRNLILFAVFSLFLVGVGYALIASDVTINGNLVVDKTTWDVHIENVKLNYNSNVGQVPTLSENDTVLSYSVSIEKPGDLYSFTFDVVNEGTIDAMLSSIVADSLPVALQGKIDYTLAYADGTTPTANDLLEAGSMERVVVTYDYPYDIDAEDLIGVTGTNTLGLTISYVQATGTTTERDHSFYRTLSYNAIPDNVSSQFVTDESGINFKNISSETNGRGLYAMNSTMSNTYPVYYYRGAVENNNAKFAGYCWKIVRTTESGGIKLLFNGSPDGNGNCLDEASDKFIYSSTEPSLDSLAYAGYMYGTVYQSQYQDVVDTNYLYGSSFTYENGVYTLTDTDSLYDDTHHYTCFSDGTSCNTLSYIYYVTESWYDGGQVANRLVYYITLSDGKDIDDAFSEMNVNTNDSVAKTTIDNWFNNTFKTYFTTNSKNYEDSLEDSIWCNDRSTISYSGWLPDGNIREMLYFGSYTRMNAGSPSVVCPNKNDSFTVTESARGNGNLDYPVGMLTADEMMLAGGQSWVQSDFYLKGGYWFSMSPYYMDSGDSYYPFSYPEFTFVYSYSNGNENTGMLIGRQLNTYYNAIRPAITLKNSVKVANGGNGTLNKPYEFLAS